MFDDIQGEAESSDKRQCADPEGHQTGIDGKAEVHPSFHRVNSVPEVGPIRDV